MTSSLFVPDSYWRRALGGWFGERVTVGLRDDGGCCQEVDGELVELLADGLVVALRDCDVRIPYSTVHYVEAISDAKEVTV